MKTITAIASLALALTVSAQNVTVPTTCEGPYMPGTDTVLYTVPYTYAQVLSIIGSYKNLTWSGNPDNTVTLNGSDNTVGTARTYDLQGLHVIETILVYDSPPGGPYYEDHNTYLITVPRPAAQGGNVSVYIPNDATTVMSVCNGKATSFNFTASFCSNNVTAAGSLLHMLHMTDAVTVGKFLGGQNFTSCQALGANATSTGVAPMPTYTGGVEGRSAMGYSAMLAGLAVAGLIL